MDDLLDGAVDVHVHTAPDLKDRHGTDLELARDALDAGMRGVVVKSHWLPTVARVDAVNEAVGEEILYGGVALNGPVGGINPDAASVALGLGAKVVWLPTGWSAHHARRFRRQGEAVFGGFRVPDAEEEQPAAINGEVTPATRRVIDLVADHDAVLATGHASPGEIEAVVDACADAGARCLVNHPFNPLVGMDLDTQERVAERGAVLEYCANVLDKADLDHTPERIVSGIERVGPGNCVLATDYGQAHNPPVAGFEAYLRGLIDAGLDRDTARELVTERPAGLLAL